jgi:translation initiation factor 2B subunit (eIF-2B alpha/beta/delta family)
VLRIIAEISALALRTNDDQQRWSQEGRALREALKQTTAELEEAAKLADVLYETCQHMGSVIDQLLKDRGIERKRSESFEILLTRVLRQREGHREEAAEQSANGDKVQGNTR